jgi:hypothetical protein
MMRTISITLLVAIAFFAASSCAPAMAANFQIRQGINVAGPYVRIRRVSSGEVVPRLEYWGSAEYSNWYTGTDLRHMGFDFVRLPVNPVPLLASAPDLRSRLLDEIVNWLKGYTSAGLRVIVDLHFWSPPDKFWFPANLVPERNIAAFEAYRSLIRSLSERLARLPHGVVALELLNEPPSDDCRGDGWIREQRTLLADARAVTRELPLVVTGCGGQLEGLLALDAYDVSFRDRNLLFTFHFYEPFVFTHQGGYVEYRYFSEIPYPASAGTLASTIEKTNEAIDTAITRPLDRAIAKRLAASQIEAYFALATDRKFVERRLAQVVTWARAHDVSVDRIFLGEFAAINWRNYDTPQYLRSRKTWNRDVRAAAARLGIASAYWNLPYPKGPTTSDVGG